MFLNDVTQLDDSSHVPMSECSVTLMLVTNGISKAQDSWNDVALSENLLTNGCILDILKEFFVDGDDF